ncbi:MAG: ABC transporter substrate-binding protein [Methanomicrobiales archaeon]|nr:ABC transporter substrate-binding protein [Methanomicrobiales archaeon]
MTVYLGIDDTDMPDTPGTGRIARAIASQLFSLCDITGITRHQLYVHPDIPYTSHNSCAVIHCRNGDPEEIFSFAHELLLDQFVEGSDPGIAVADAATLGPSVVAFGMDAKHTILTQEKARSIARHSNILLEGLAGTEGGVIGALAGIGLAATGNDGRFVQRGRLRELHGTQDALTLISEGVDVILTDDGRSVTEGYIWFHKFPKPAFVGGKAVLFVRPVDGHYEEIFRD